jgi:hypothetical protein
VSDYQTSVMRHSGDASGQCKLGSVRDGLAFQSLLSQLQASPLTSSGGKWIDHVIRITARQLNFNNTEVIGVFGVLLDLLVSLVIHLARGKQICSMYLG